MKVYLVEAHDFEWHNTIAVKSDKEKAIDIARKTSNEVAPRGCQVWEHEVDSGKKGKRVYPNW